MKLLLFIFLSIKAMASDDLPPFRSPHPWIYNTSANITVPHVQEPVNVVIKMVVLTYPEANYMDIILRLYHRGQEITRRNIQLYW